MKHSALLQNHEWRSTQQFSVYFQRMQWMISVDWRTNKNLHKVLEKQKWGINNIMVCLYCTVKQSHYRSAQALRVPGGWGSQISRQLSYKGGRVVSSTHWPPLRPRKYSWFSFLSEAESTPGPQCGRKNYVNKKFQRYHREWNPRLSS